MAGMPQIYRPVALTTTDRPVPTCIEGAVAALPCVLAEKYGDLAAGGPSPRLRSRFGHATPDDWYEAVVDTLVDAETTWLDVGCGRDLFPSNQPTAHRLTDLCRRIVGIDPDPNIADNSFIDEGVQTTLEGFDTDERFDLITMRMVAEHVTDPAGVVAKLRSLLVPGGRVVIYTVNRRSPSSMVAAVTPMRFHHLVKRILWATEERDTFPTVYRMNSRAELRAQFASVGMREEAFARLDDCRSTTAFLALNTIELTIAALCRWVGVPYPEHCLLGVYTLDAPRA